MKCYYCPLSHPDDVCPECEGKYGIEFKDGSLGCRHPRNWVEKRDSEYTEYLGKMGTDMGIEMDFSESDLDRLLEICKHMVGLDYASPYHRHGKAFYKPYRNYYEAPPFGNKLLDKLPNHIIKKTNGQLSAWYELTSQGLAWLGRQCKICIKEYEKE